MSALTKAIEIAGTQAALSRGLTAADPSRPVTPQMLHGWKTRGQIPVSRVQQFAKATGIPLWEIRPDIYDPPEKYFVRAMGLSRAVKSE